MKIKEALSYIFLNAGKIQKLSEEGVVCAVHLVTLYLLYLEKADNKIYESRLCQLCEQVKSHIDEENS